MRTMNWRAVVDAPLFYLGFRIFFASATFFALLTMAEWLLAFRFGRGWVVSSGLPLPYWHGHEMVFGYAQATVAGFLFTAVGNWTRQPMPSGAVLMAIWSPWFLARLLFALGRGLILAQLLDLGFALAVAFFVARPVVRVKQWRQMGIVAKLVLLVVANLLYLGGALGVLGQGLRWGLYLGVFLVIGLLLTIGRRVTPFFIQNATGVQLRNDARLDRLSLWFFLGFTLLEVFSPWPKWAGCFALGAAVVNGLRLRLWYTPLLWRFPLLWSMYLSLWAIVLGFALFFIRSFWAFSPSLALHMLAVGGIGVMTFSMMGRVSLGHTGRNIHQPPRALSWGFGLLLFAVFFRVLMPLFLPRHYALWIVHAQVAWLLAFALLFGSYAKIWSTPRADGRSG